MVPKKSTNFFLVNIDDISSDRLIVEIKNNNNSATSEDELLASKLEPDRVIFVGPFWFEHDELS